MRDDGRKDLAKAIPILEVASRLGIDGLRRAGVEQVGPCPMCGGKDRFGINPALGVFICRSGGDGGADAGGDGLALVQHVRGCDFMAALAFLVGGVDVAVDPAEVARRKNAALVAEAKRSDVAAKMRARAVRDAREIWARTVPLCDTLGARYLSKRGLGGFVLPPALRFLPDQPYVRRVGGEYVTFHRGPCMVAAIQNARGRITAVHQTWIDPIKLGQKAQIVDGAGAPLPVKIVRGSKKGGAIRLSPLGSARTMVVGEGIETTATAAVINSTPGAVYWSLVDLGNMAGRQVNMPNVRTSGVPDMSDLEAWVPPAQIDHLVVVQDGDSEPKATRAKVLACIRRAQNINPNLTGSIVHPGAGRDLNDLVQVGQDENEGRDVN